MIYEEQYKMTQREIEKILNEYKRSKKEDLLYLLPIYQKHNLAGYLHPITYDYKISLPGIIGKLSTWRRNTPFAWNSVFEITDERTELWVEKYVLKNENRIIFVIQDLENHYLGQIGLAGINGEQRSAEIDAVVRGEKNLRPGIMGASLNTIIAWGKKKLCLENISLDVFDDNTHAIDFYKKNGFIECGQTALIKEESSAETRWHTDESLDPVKACRRYIQMKLATIKEEK